ncbi:TRAP transporter small permease [Hahella ganghwensis]|uniref:TRAP transporter small permease n=1 Tax=Hahella ganghwensis TaxID=286420 RepID=UPI00037DB287|nr:TRAP transporter small permease [Hahella ganghwensis]
MRRILDVIYTCGAGLAAVFILGICLLVAAQVFMNLVDRLLILSGFDAVGLSIPSYADFTGFFLAASSFLALAYTMRAGGHIRVTLMLHQLSPKWRHVFEVASLLTGGVLTIYFAFYTGRLVWDSFIYEDLSAGIISVPLWIPQFSMLLGLIILSISFIDDIVCVLSGEKPSYHGKGEEALLEKEAPTTMYEGE